MGKPTENDIKIFNNLDNMYKVDCLYQYLVLGRSMTDVNYTVFSNAHDGRRVSRVLRCYGFEGNNSE